MGVFYLLSGSDEFAIKTKAREIACSICGDPPEDNPDLEIIPGDPDDMRPNEIIGRLLNTLNTPSFLSPQKVVWLKNYAHFQGGTANKNKKNAEELTTLADYIKAGVDDDVTLIIDGPNIDRRKSFYKSCKNVARVSFFEKSDLSDKNFTQNQRKKIHEMCEKYGRKVDYNAERYLSETIGSDSGRLKNEMEKLFAFTDGKEIINVEDCKAICSKTPEALSWAFSDSLMNKNVKSALETINILAEQQKTSGSSYKAEIGILASAVRSFQELVKVKMAAAELGIKGSVSKNFFYSIDKSGYPGNYLLTLNPFRAYMVVNSSNKFGDRELADILSELIKTNRKLVSGAGEARLELEQLVLKILN